MREAYDLTMKDGSVLSLKYSFKAIRFFERQTGGTFFGDSAAGRIGADYLSAGIAAGLLWRNPNIKMDEVDAAIERHIDAGGDLPFLVEQLMEALKNSGILKGPDAAARPTPPAESAGE